MAALATSCGGAQSRDQVAMPELPPRTTTATLAGPLCQGSSCRCAKTPAEAGTPESKAVKRYQIVLGPSDNELWAKVGEMVLYKGVERAKECFYVDLPAPGERRVSLRGHGEDGFGARMAINELAPGAAGWYQTFEFHCGAPGACRTDQLRDFRASLDRYERGIHDPCGSTKIQGLSWDTGRMPDVGVPADLHLQLTLKMYAFEPSQPPGHPGCKDNY